MAIEFRGELIRTGKQAEDLFGASPEIRRSDSVFMEPRSPGERERNHDSTVLFFNEEFCCVDTVGDHDVH